MLTIATFLPVVNLILSPEILDFYIIKVFISIFDKFGLKIENNITYYIFGIFIIIILVNTFIKLYITYYSQNFIKNTASSIAHKALSSLFSKNYEQIISKNSNEIVSALVIKIDEAINFLIHLLQIVTSSFISVAIIISLFIVDFIVTFYLISIFSIIYGLILFFLRKRTNKISLILSENFDTRLKVVQDNITYLRQILLTNNKNFYLNNFVKKDKNIRKSNLQMYLYSQFPRIAIETIGIITFSIITFILLSFMRYDQTYIITILAIVIYAFQKLLIAFNQVYVSSINISALKQSTWDIISVIENNRNSNYQETQNLEFKNLKIKNVSFKYKSQESLIFENLNIDINKGDKIGIVGESGSGKSTFLDIFCGLLNVNQGEILINNIPLHTVKNEWQNLISYGSQNLFTTEESILENIAIGSDKTKVDKKLLLTSCERSESISFINALKEKFDTKLGTGGVRLSGGQAQRVGLARIFYNNSSVMLFDESTNSLDNETEKRVIDNIKNYYDDRTILIVSHNKNILDFCNKIFRFEKGKIKEVSKKSL
tara:strand:- start:10114 stop:11748 length:1635 start_codon:yes stop_codon:yes gene_type:complete